MLSKKEIKDIQSLSQKKFRDALKLFVAEGPKTVEELCALMPGSLEKIYCTSAWKSRADLLVSEDKIVLVDELMLSRLSHLQTPNLVLAVFHQFENNAPPAHGFCLYLDGIQDPGNLGTIIRTADWFGIKNIVCSDGCADVYNPKVVQSTMGSIGRVEIYYEPGGWLQKQSRPVFAAVLHGEPMDRVQKIKEGILVIGNESKGISPGLLALATHKITIPKTGGAESLNAAVATGIILSHLLA